MKVLVFSFFLMLLFTELRAQDPDSSSSTKEITPWFVERFKLSAGFFLPVNNTNIKVGVDGSDGTDVDFENDLGLAKNIGTFLANFQWRISRRSRISLSYAKINRSSTITLKKDITFEDQTFPENSSVNSFFNTSIYQLSYGYAIISKPKFEAGLEIGTHLVSVKTGISQNGTGGTITKSSDFGVIAPLPDLGIWGGYTFTKRFALKIELDYLSLTVEDISGSIFAYNIGCTYKLIDKLDLSLGFIGLNFKVDAVKEDTSALMKWSYNGPNLGITFSFGNKSWGH